MEFLDPPVESYCFDHTQAEPELLQELAKATHEQMEYPQMLTGRLEGRFLKPSEMNKVILVKPLLFIVISLFNFYLVLFKQTVQQSGI